MSACADGDEQHFRQYTRRAKKDINPLPVMETPGVQSDPRSAREACFGSRAIARRHLKSTQIYPIRQDDYLCRKNPASLDDIVPQE